MHYIDSTVLGQENRRFGGARSQPSQSSVPDGPTLASEFGFSLQCQAGSSSVLRRPIEITRVTGHSELADRHMSGFRVNQELRRLASPPRVKFVAAIAPPSLLSTSRCAVQCPACIHTRSRCG
jgi:hypothetical protein